MIAFSNGAEYESWAAHWCNRCVKDDEYRTTGRGAGCPILADVFVNETVPPEWTPGTDDLCDRYHCSEFEPL